MKKIDFNSELYTNNLVIDKAHQQIVEYYNTLVDIIVTGDEMSMFVTVLDKMSEYSFKHFKDEEEFMSSFSYPHLKEHKELHHNYLKQVALFNAKYLQPGSTNPEDVLDFLSKWWCNHILEHDMKYINYSKKG